MPAAREHYHISRQWENMLKLDDKNDCHLVLNSFFGPQVIFLRNIFVVHYPRMKIVCILLCGLHMFG